MCQSVPSGYDATPLAPHKYPIWISIFAVLIAVMMFASLISFPAFLVAGRQLHKASNLFEKNEFKSAADIYLEVLNKYPGAFEARLGAAESLFSEHEKAADAQALELLDKVKLDKYDWKRIAKVMPDEYKKMFTTSADDEDAVKSDSSSDKSSSKKSGDKLSSDKSSDKSSGRE